ncbi:MAG: HigA family addiction module antidote protein [Desulfuromonadales bacterium]|nr:HigA family addiction module antidote protein [Desulfuromonadales bacterium]
MASHAPHTDEAPARHPGSVLAHKFMSPAGLSQNGLARALGIPPQRIGDIVLGRRAVTVDTAVRLAEYFATDPRYWLDLQREYDLSRVDQAAICRQVRPPENSPGRAQRQIEKWILREHAIIAERLLSEPDRVIAKAKENITRWGWLRDFPDPQKRPDFMAEWLNLLDGSIGALQAILTGEDERAVRLRSSSPFAGIVSSRERWQLRKRQTGENNELESA